MKVKNSKISNDFYALIQLTKRAMKIFLKDKATVFFSLLSPLIVFLLYILFLGDVQVETLLAAVPEGVTIDIKLISNYVDTWMFAGVLSSACITVSLSANNVMVQDRERGNISDSLASPIKKWIITFSYFLFNFLVTLIIVLVALMACLLYTLIHGSWCFTFITIIKTIGIIILSILSSTLITVFISGFFKSEAVLGAVVGIMSAVLGFLIGAYMPMGMMPNIAQYVSGIIPGSHSAGLFRQVLMSGPLNSLKEFLPPKAIVEISEAFSLKINFFGTYVGSSVMLIYLSASIVIFIILNKIFGFKKKIK